MTKMVQRYMYLSVETLKELKAMAIEKGLTISGLVRMILLDYIRKVKLEKEKEINTNSNGKY